MAQCYETGGERRLERNIARRLGRGRSTRCRLSVKRIGWQGDIIAMSTRRYKHGGQKVVDRFCDRKGGLELGWLKVSGRDQNCRSCLGEIPFLAKRRPERSKVAYDRIKLTKVLR